jgi:CubicO group peptidase (beta-lactamase class C family)
MYVSTREQPNSRSGSFRRNALLGLNAGALLALAACGGGGGGGSSTPPPPPPPTNQAPVAQAGVDQTVEYPAGATVTGTATDDGAASSLTYAWSAATGGVAFSAATAATTDVTFPSAGSYELTLTVSDGTTTGTDKVVVTVSPATYPAADDDSQTDHGWTRVAAAADVGMTQAGLDQATTYALTGGGSGMIVRKGRLVHSWGDIDVTYEMKSTTKSMGGIALGLAIDEGKLQLTDAAQTHMPAIGVEPAANVATGWLPQITILQLATHTAGFDKPGGYNASLLYQPGTTWSYSDGGLNWLADLLSEKYGQDLRQLMTTRVWSVLGVTTDDLTWRDPSRGLRAPPLPASQPQTVVHRELASGIEANANAMARVGLLFLRKGVWTDQRVVSESFVETVHTPQAAVASATNIDPTNFPGATTNYGVLWWTNKDGQLANVPRDAYWAWGLGDSLIVVIPSLDLIIARAGPQVLAGSTGRVWNDSDWNGDYSVLAPLLDPIVQSVTP